jgi:flagellar biosynthesis protein FlhB
MADETSGEKTEDATARRVEEAREKGQVAFSTEFIAALALIAALVMYKFASAPVLELLAGDLRKGLSTFGTIGTMEMDMLGAQSLMRTAADHAMEAILIFAGPMVVWTSLVAFGQVGFHISPKAVEFDPTKLNPVKGVGRLFSMKSMARVGMSILKLGFIAISILVTAYSEVGRLSKIGGTDIGPMLLLINSVILRAIATALFAILILGLVDLLYQRWQHAKDLKMSKQEVKDEGKAQEGDPLIKAKIREVQRELSSRRMMDAVPEATVVVTNPTHYAVALTYDRHSTDGGAPEVVAKGVDLVAQKIKEIARENDVICFENVPLARALHAQCEIGDVIPEDLFDAVANVLAYVYRVQAEGAAA